MATVRKRSNGTFEIRYINQHGKRKGICLPPAEKNRRIAESTATKIDHIASRLSQGAEPDRDVSEWIAGLPEKLHSKFVKHGLVAPRQSAETLQPEPDESQVPSLKNWTDDYIENHPGKAGTIEQLEISARSLCKRFGDDKPIDTFTAGDAESYRKWLQTKGNERKKYVTGLAKGTVRRRIGRAKQFFNAAIKHELITRNPFANEASASTGNPERLFMVPADWIEACIQNAPCEDWRIILAFARYAGMRSHETRIQKWADIDLTNDLMIIRSHKTPPVRRCPIFPELRPHLMRAKQHATKGAVYVQTRYGHDDNILTTMEKIVIRAGLVPWEKPMQNLRATRETELLSHYPAKDVTGWLGNSPTVANNHYAMPMQESFDRAVKDGAKIIGVTSGGQAKLTPKRTQTTHAIGGQRMTADPKHAKSFINAMRELISSCPTRT